MTAVAFDLHLEPIVDSLTTRSNGAYDTDFIRDLVMHVAAEFDGAPVQDYLPVLIAKEATDELRKLNGLQAISS